MLSKRWLLLGFIGGLLALVNGGLVAQRTAQLQVGIDLPERVLITQNSVTVRLQVQAQAGACPVEERSSDVVLLLPDQGRGLGDPQVLQDLVSNLSLQLSLAEQGDQLGVLSYNNAQASTLSPLSQNVNQLTQLLGGLPGGATAPTLTPTVINDAVQALIDAETQNPLADRELVILASGISDDYVERNNLRLALEQASSAGAHITLLLTEADPALNEFAQEIDDLLVLQAQPNALRQQLATVVGQIQRGVAARDLRLEVNLRNQGFQLARLDTSPPSSRSGNTLIWNVADLLDGETAEFVFYLAPQQAGTYRPFWVEGSYNDCGDPNQNVSFGMQEANPIQVLMPTATPLPTATATALPATPMATATPRLGIEQTVIESDTRATIRNAQQILGIPLCETGLWGFVPWLLAILFLLFWLWLLMRTWRKVQDEKMRWPCWVLGSLAWLSLLGVLWLFLLPVITFTCQGPQNVYFWRQEALGGVTGVYLAAPDGQAYRAFSELNSTGCVGCHTASAQGDFVAAVSGIPPGNLIVFDDDRQRVTIPELQATYLAFSPDGRSIAFSDENMDLNVLNLDDNRVRSLRGANDPDVAEIMPSWGPSGQIAFVRVEDLDNVYYAGTEVTAPATIYAVPESGGQARPIEGAGDAVFNYYPAYSPDGQWLAFTRHNNDTTYSDEAAEIWLVPADGGTPRRLTANDDATGPLDNVSNSWPSWSNDSRLLAFNSKRNDERFDIFITDIDEEGRSGSVRPLSAGAQPNVFEHTPFWGANLYRIDVVAAWWDLRWWPLLPLLLFLLRSLICRPPLKIIPPEKVKVGFKGAPAPIKDKLITNPVIWEARPALIIGLGETGRWVLTHLKKNLCDAGGGEISPDIRLLALDFGQASEEIALGEVHLEPHELVLIDDNLNRFLANELDTNDPVYRYWVDRQSLGDLGREALDLSTGRVRGNRVLARLGLLHHLQQADQQADRSHFWPRLKAAIRACLDDKRRLRVMIVGDTMGDISSAGLVDVALMVQRAVERQQLAEGSVTHLFLINAPVSSDRETYRRQQLNAAATMREIERHQLAGSRPFQVHYGLSELDGLVATPPFDQINLYDRQTLPDAPLVSGLYPMVADIMTLELDSASRKENFVNWQDATHGALRDVQRTTGQLHLLTQRMKEYRLPFFDIAHEMARRWRFEVVYRFIMGETGTIDKQTGPTYLSLSPELKGDHLLRLSRIEGQETPDDFVRALFFGELDLGRRNKNDEADRFIRHLMGGGGEENLSERDLKRLAHEVRRNGTLESMGGIYIRRMEGIVLWILNGDENLSDDQMIVGRGGKMGFTLAFLEHLQAYLETIRERFQDFKLKELLITHNPFAELEERREEIHDRLKRLINLVFNVEEDAGRINEEGEQRSLFGHVNYNPGDLLRQHQANAEKLQQRQTIWRDENGRDLQDVWYERYLAPKIAEGLSHLYWSFLPRNGDNLDDETKDKDKKRDLWLRIRVKDWFGRGTGEQLLKTEEVADILYDFAMDYISRIREEHTLYQILAQGDQALADGQIETTVRQTNKEAQPLLQIDKTQAEQRSESWVILANRETPIHTVVRDTIKKQAGGPSDESIIDLQTQNPYAFGIMRQKAIFPLSALPWGDMWALYDKEYGLSADPSARQPDEPIPTAVYQAEAEALKIESRLKKELNVNLIYGRPGQEQPRRLHPLVVTALSDYQRLRAFCLALAADEIEVEDRRDDEQPEIVTLLASKEIVFNDLALYQRLKESPINPYLAALLTFINDHETFNDALIARMMERYRTDQDIIGIWRDWLANKTDGWGATQQRYAQHPDYRKQQAAMDDLIAVARLKASDFSRDISG